MAQLPDLPPVIDRPPLAEWAWRRGLTLDDLADVFRRAGLPRSREYVRQLLLPFDHPKRVTPTQEEATFIACWTRGGVVPSQFRPAKAEATGAVEGAP